MSRSPRIPRNRLQPHQVSEIRRLKAAGCTQTEIKRITGHSRTTIHQILTGKHSAANEKPTESAEDDVSSFFDGPIERCPQCGRRVHMPCMPCRVDSMMNTGQVVPSSIQEADRRQIART
ncbi:hypothetical protein ACYFX5_12740 [Bremerella sp. T1]|uniref:hypothetical protein n=1 Tax=Bremerella sp. TYQ1 TaxID=3119568 RepID=UPI001CCC0819|nr:hypothetical protein [Bremerella volcania]UBM33927.1 hypothetical protein LA756_14685 [Bremerella volcania]